MVLKMYISRNVVVLCLYLTVTQAEHASSIETLLKRMDKFEEQGRYHQLHIAQQDKLLKLYKEKLDRYETQLQQQSNRIEQLEDQLYSTGQGEKRLNEQSTTRIIKHLENQLRSTGQDKRRFAKVAVPIEDEISRQLKGKLNAINQSEEGKLSVAGQEFKFSNDAADLDKAANKRNPTRITGTITNESIKFPRLLLDNAEGPVAFHATTDLGINTPVGLNQHILYEDVHLNLCNGFHELHGLFIAPKAGMYLFSTSIMTHVSQGSILATIVKNGSDLARAYANGNSGVPDQGSVTVVTQLNVGDEVWVKSYGRTAASDYGDKFTSFMGILLIEM